MSQTGYAAGRTLRGVRRAICRFLMRREGFPEMRAAILTRQDQLDNWKALQVPDGHLCHTYPAAERLGLEMPPHEYRANGTAVWGKGDGWVVVVAPWTCDREPCIEKEVKE